MGCQAARCTIGWLMAALPVIAIDTHSIPPPLQLPLSELCIGLLPPRTQRGRLGSLHRIARPSPAQGAQLGTDARVRGGPLDFGLHQGRAERPRGRALSGVAPPPGERL